MPLDQQQHFISLLKEMNPTIPLTFAQSHSSQPWPDYPNRNPLPLAPAKNANLYQATSLPMSQISQTLPRPPPTPQPLYDMSRSYGGHVGHILSPSTTVSVPSPSNNLASQPSNYFDDLRARALSHVAMQNIAESGRKRYLFDVVADPAGIRILSRSVFVYDFDQSISDIDVHRTFDDFGDLEEVLRDGRKLFIRFAHRKSAEAVLTFKGPMTLGRGTCRAVWAAPFQQSGSFDFHLGQTVMPPHFDLTPFLLPIPCTNSTQSTTENKTRSTNNDNNATTGASPPPPESPPLSAQAPPKRQISDNRDSDSEHTSKRTKLSPAPSDSPRSSVSSFSMSSLSNDAEDVIQAHPNGYNGDAERLRNSLNNRSPSPLKPGPSSPQPYSPTAPNTP